jgi:starch phosphorylase
LAVESFISTIPQPTLFPLEEPRRLDIASLKQELLQRMVREVGRDPSYCSKQDWFYALAFVLRERLTPSG